MKVLVVEPMKPCEVRDIPDTLDAMRQIVGGDIEPARIPQFGFVPQSVPQGSRRPP